MPTRSTVIAATMALVLLGAAGCADEQPAGVSLPSPEQPPTLTPKPTYVAAPPPTRPATSGPATFDERVAVSCAGRPGADQVITLLRRTPGLLPGGVTVTVRTGPLCSGTWQFTVVTVPDREPLQVVTKGAPSALTLVTAGTDVCTAPVRAGAPAGILTVARCT